MNKEWKDKGRAIGKSGDLLLTQRNADAAPSEGDRSEYVRVSKRDMSYGYWSQNVPAASDFDATKTVTTNYFGNKVYVNNQLKYVLTEEGYIERTTGGKIYTAYYYLNDHLGNHRIVTDGSGNVKQVNNYYPSGTSMTERQIGVMGIGGQSDQGVQPYKFGGRELDRFDNLDFYDFDARAYYPALMRFMRPDPMAEKYPGISPYAYCGNNPVNRIDPSGKDVWEINGQGRIINRIEDKAQDAFYMVAKDADGNYQRTYTTDSEGNKDYNEISFKYGTIESQRSITYSPDGQNVDTYDIYQVRGDNNGTALFEFLGEHVTGSPSMVEIGQAKTGIEGDKGLNFITTGHTERQEPGSSYLLAGQLYYGYTVRELNHTHPITPGPSSNDLQYKTQVIDVFRNQGLHIPNFNIFHVPSKTYISY